MCAYTCLCCCCCCFEAEFRAIHAKTRRLLLLLRVSQGHSLRGGERKRKKREVEKLERTKEKGGDGIPRADWLIDTFTSRIVCIIYLMSKSSCFLFFFFFCAEVDFSTRALVSWIFHPVIVVINRGDSAWMIKGRVDGGWFLFASRGAIKRNAVVVGERVRMCVCVWKPPWRGLNSDTWVVREINVGKRRRWALWVRGNVIICKNIQLKCWARVEIWWVGFNKVIPWIM